MRDRPIHAGRLMEKRVSPIDAPKRLPNDPRKSSSFMAQVTDLEVGESALKATQVDLSQMDETYVADLRERRATLRNNLASATRTAFERTAGAYSTEITDLFMPSGRLFIVAVVTRTE